jgi:hypothetical protein
MAPLRVLCARPTATRVQSRRHPIPPALHRCHWQRLRSTSRRRRSTIVARFGRHGTPLRSRRHRPHLLNRPMAIRSHAPIPACASSPHHGAHGWPHACGRQLLPPTDPPGRALNTQAAPYVRRPSLLPPRPRPTSGACRAPVVAPFNIPPSPRQCPGSSPAPTSPGLPPVTPLRHPVGAPRPEYGLVPDYGRIVNR